MVGTSGVARFVEQWLGRMGACSVHPGLHAAWRVGFGVLAILMALRALPLVSFLWWHQTPAWASFGTTLNYLWVPLAVLVTLGLGGRVMLVAHLLVASTVLEFEITGPRNVEESLYLINSTWLVFAGTGSRFSIDAWWRARRGKGPVTVPGWPMRLMAINFSMIFFFGGLTKLFDPFWRHGLGYYYAMLLPWVTVDTFDWVLDIKPLIIVMNYGGIAFEMGLLGLVLVRRLRPVAWVMSAVFFATITYPFQLGFIGPIGLAMVFGMAAARDEPLTATSRPPLPMVAMLAYMTLFFAIGLGKYGVPRYPLLYPPTIVVEDDGTMHQPTDRPSMLELAVGATPPALRPVLHGFAYVNEHMTKVTALVLFNAVHAVGIWLPRFEAVLEDGTRIEPEATKLVHYDLSAGPAVAGLSPRFVMIIGYWNGEIANRVATRADYRPSPYEEMWIRSTFAFVEHELTDAQRDQLKWISWHVRPVVMPETYVGNTRVDVVPWVEMLRYDPTDASFALFQRPEPYPTRPVVMGFENPAWLEIHPGPAPPALGSLPRHQR